MPAQNRSAGDPLGLVAQMVALAGDQAETRGRVDQLAGAVEDLGGQVTELGGNDTEVQAQLSDVRTALDEVAAAIEKLGAEPEPPVLWVWADMDTDTQRAKLRELAQWVEDILIGRYRLSAEALPRCWYRHPDAVEELSWLYLDWARIYLSGRGTSTSAAGEWHDRWLPGVLTRVGKRLSGCTRGEHREQMVQPPPPLDTGFDTYLAALDNPPPDPAPGPPPDDGVPTWTPTTPPTAPWPSQQPPAGPWNPH